MVLSRSLSLSSSSTDARKLLNPGRTASLRTDNDKTRTNSKTEVKNLRVAIFEQAVIPGRPGNELETALEVSKNIFYNFTVAKYC